MVGKLLSIDKKGSKVVDWRQSADAAAAIMYLTARSMHRSLKNHRAKKAEVEGLDCSAQFFFALVSRPGSSFQVFFRAC